MYEKFIMTLGAGVIITMAALSLFVFFIAPRLSCRSRLILRIIGIVGMIALLLLLLVIASRFGFA